MKDRPILDYARRDEATSGAGWAGAAAELLILLAILIAVFVLFMPTLGR